MRNQHTSPKCDENDQADSDDDQRSNESKLIVQVIRGIGILPIVLFVLFLASYDIFLGHISSRSWLHPIVDETRQVALLTISAGNLAIMAVFISFYGRRREGYRWGTLALLAAGVATFMAGYRGLDADEHIGVQLIVVTQCILVFFVVLTTPIARAVENVWQLIKRILWSKSSLKIFAVIGLIWLVFYNQSQNENYIENWLLIPLGVLFSIIVSIVVFWLVAKNLPLGCKWLYRKGRNIYCRIKSFFRRNK